MEAFEIGGLIEEQAASDARYLEFLRVPDLSSGLYVLPAGADDTQQPHDEDEVYFNLPVAKRQEEDQHACDAGVVEEEGHMDR